MNFLKSLLSVSSSPTPKEDAKSDIFDDDEEDQEVPLYIVQFFKKLACENEMSDVRFVVGEGRKQQVFPAHRLILASTSPIFEAMLYDRTATEQDLTEDPIVVRLPHDDPAAFSLFLTAIYTDELDISPELFPALVLLSKKYLVEKVQLKCTTYMAKEITPENVCQLFSLGVDLPGSKELLLEEIYDNASDVFASKGFLEFRSEKIVQLIRSDHLNIKEEDLMDALIRWSDTTAGSDEKAKLAYMKQFAPYIRFPLLPLHYLASVVADLGLLNEDKLLELFQYLALSSDKDKLKARTTFNSTPRAGADPWKPKGTTTLKSKHRKDIFGFFGSVTAPAPYLKLDLVYRASRDGKSASVFHSRCDAKSQLLVVIKAKGSSALFGGYYSGFWASSGGDPKRDTFLFSLAHPASTTAFRLNPRPKDLAAAKVAFAPSKGPTFGISAPYDLDIDSSFESCTTAAGTFGIVAPGYSIPGGGAYSDLTLLGTNKFSIAEMEVFSVKLTK